MPLDQTPRARPATTPLPAYAKTRFRSLLKPRRRRRIKPFELSPAEQILHHIFNNADFIAAHRTIGHRGYPTDVIHLLLSLDVYDFRMLCVVGAELEDAEASVGEDDRESDELDTPLDRPGEGYELDHGEGPDSDDEPSLGMPDSMLNHERAAKTCVGNDADLEDDGLTTYGEGDDLWDGEGDDCDKEPSLLCGAGSAGTVDCEQEDGYVRTADIAAAKARLGKDSTDIRTGAGKVVGNATPSGAIRVFIGKVGAP